MNERRQGILTSIGLLVLRIGIGGYLMTHGYPKLVMAAQGQFKGFGDPIGIGEALSLLGAVGAEFFCALLVALGLLTRVAAVPVAFTMGVAAFVIHQADPYTITAGAPRSKELAMLFLIPMVTLVFTGPGWFSLDALVYPYLGRRRARRHAHKQQPAPAQPSQHQEQRQA
jgi:putative oxidoreductase